nr:MAG TPA: hypothetical protein [Caudoviricetes sp.]DAM75548.1 MAG TPA: hypothetical protein [Caudoviricetes sp.]DAS02282.1 MAG TPA: hypothetical protein [Caudoviricetes sp.]
MRLTFYADEQASNKIPSVLRLDWANIKNRGAHPLQFI